MMEEKILIVEDEKKLNTMIADYLGSLDYQTVSVFNGRDALSAFREKTIDLILLDIRLPGIDGIDVLRRIREQSSVPVIILTARVTENDKLLGLDLGADDYVSKPFSLKELAARMRSVLRRTRVNSGFRNNSDNAGREAASEYRNSGEIIKYKDLTLDTASRTMKRKEIPVQLTSAQFEIMRKLMENPGRVFTRLDLLESFQDTAYEGYERTIDVHIKNIRKALEMDPSHPAYIKTVWGVGYKLEME
jgi:DNA-binding response OmpR family regulator